MVYFVHQKTRTRMMDKMRGKDSQSKLAIRRVSPTGEHQKDQLCSP
jgi:hypothetical protein